MHTSIMVFGILVAAAGLYLGLGSVFGIIAFAYSGVLFIPAVVVFPVALGAMFAGVMLALFSYRRANDLTQRLVKAIALISWSSTMFWLGLGILGVLTRLNIWGGQFFSDSFEYPIMGWALAFLGVLGLIRSWALISGSTNTIEEPIP